MPCVQCSVRSNSLQPHGLYFLSPWDFPGKNTGVGSGFLLQGSSWPRNRTCISCASSISHTGRQILYHWVPGKARTANGCSVTLQPCLLTVTSLVDGHPSPTPPMPSNSWAGNAIWALLLLSHFSRVQLCATPETAAHQAPPSLGFSRQEHWSGLPFPSPMHASEKWKWSRSVVSDF